MKWIDRSRFLQQVVPLCLTLIILGFLVVLLYIYVTLINRLPFGQPILLKAQPMDIVVGLTIYLKTSIDFAIFMGRLMTTNPGWRGRIALEVGTAMGNALGTLVVIALWAVLKHVDFLLAVMVFLASLVLFELAHGGLEHLSAWENSSLVKSMIFKFLHLFLDTIKKFTDPVLAKVLPDLGEKLKGKEGLTWWGLFLFSMSIPFILGLDDFAGYVPLFNVVNVFGFAIGVFTGHTILNIALFISPNRTIIAVKNEYVSFLGTLAFIGLAFYGLYEVWRILAHIFL